MPELRAAAPYKYQGLPLTPNVIAELAREVLKTPMFRRSELINAVEQHHAENGGAAALSLTSATKKALRNLVDGGLLEPTGAYGYWRWVTPPDQTVREDRSSLVDDETDELDLTDSIVEGAGAGSVYVYYFPGYRLLADLRRDDRWPIKVGMTSVGDAKIRISDQQGTAMPEQPLVAYVRRSDTPLKLERLVHAVLFYRGRQLDDAPGSEWFSSNPEEIKSIIDWAHACEGT
ncbi:GIY-YIG nuclease family protein [Arthrobacter sp. UC242_113]|uniref:GIY-YIG nuclease family protein n=1 Tax=Arthrobacter sp. UC242_113 TaxID=3374550 RepID=UPI0037579B47